MVTKTWEEFCDNFDEISKICHTDQQPVFITKDGEVDLVAISAEEYEYMTIMITPQKIISTSSGNFSDECPFD